MKIHIIAIGKRMPTWVDEAFQTYLERFPNDIQIEVKAMDVVKRHKKMPVQEIIEQEGEALLSAIPERSQVIALDEKGEQWSTLALSKQFQSWQEASLPVSFLIGGPDGLSQNCLNRASKKWSLSKLTFPHPFVRVIMIEQLYRAWTVLTNHPYHRN